MTILILGNDDFLGRAIYEHFSQHGLRVIFVDCLNLTRVRDDKQEIYSLDEIDSLQAFLLEKKISHIINIIYIHHCLRGGIKENADLFAQTINSTYFVLNQINDFYQNLEHKENFSYIVFFQNSIFGSQQDGELASENSQIHPASHHAAFFTSIFYIHSAYFGQLSLPISKIVIGNLYGKNQDPDINLLPMTVQKFCQKKSIIIQGNGKLLRNWLHIEDFCQMIFIMISQNIQKELLCFAGENLQVIDFIEKIGQHCDELAAQKSLDFLPFETLLKFAAQYEKKCYSYAMKSEQTFDLLKYKPKFNVENSLGDSVNYYCEIFLVEDNLKNNLDNESVK